MSDGDFFTIPVDELLHGSTEKKVSADDYQRRMMKVVDDYDRELIHNFHRPRRRRPWPKGIGQK